MTEPWAGSFRSYGAWTLLLVAAFAFINRELINGSATGIWDVDTWYVPWHVLVADAIRTGHLVLWDPWTNGGTPVSGDPQVGAFSPVVLLTGLIFGGTTYGFVLYWLLLWCSGGIGVMLLARHLGTPPAYAFAISLAYLFGGIYTGHAEHTTVVVEYSALLFIVWRLDTALKRHQILPAFQAGAIWGLAALSGYPAMTAITGMFCAVWTLGRVFTGQSDGADEPAGRRTSRLAFTAKSTALLAVTGAVVMLPTYFAFLYEGAGTTSRAGTLARETVVTENSLMSGSLLSALDPLNSMPKLYQREELWPNTDISGASIYTGAVVLLLAVFAIVVRPRDRWRWWLGGLAALSLAFALGQELPLRGWLYDLIYPTRYFRHATLFRAYYLFAITALACLGARDIARVHREPNTLFRFRTIAVLFAVAASAIIIVNALNWPFAASGAEVSPKRLWIWCGVSITVWCGLALAGFAARYRLLFIAVVVMIPFIDAVNVRSLAKNTIQARGPHVERWERLDRSHSLSMDLTPNGWYRGDRVGVSLPDGRFVLNNDHLITKTPVFDAYTTQFNSAHEVLKTVPAIRNMAVGEQRVWFAESAVEIPPSPESLNTFVSVVGNNGEAPLLVHSAQQMLSRIGNADNIDAVVLEAAVPLSPINAAVNIYLPERLAFTVNAPAEGWILVTDRWARSWKARINGSPATIYGGNFIFRAVKVPAGENKIEFRYEPPNFPILLILSWSALSIILLWSVASALAASRRPSASPPSR